MKAAELFLKLGLHKRASPTYSEIQDRACPEPNYILFGCAMIKGTVRHCSSKNLSPLIVTGYPEVSYRHYRLKMLRLSGAPVKFMVRSARCSITQPNPSYIVTSVATKIASNVANNSTWEAKIAAVAAHRGTTARLAEDFAQGIPAALPNSVAGSDGQTPNQKMQRVYVIKKSVIAARVSPPRKHEIPGTPCA